MEPQASISKWQGWPSVHGPNHSNGQRARSMEGCCGIQQEAISKELTRLQGVTDARGHGYINSS